MGNRLPSSCVNYKCLWLWEPCNASRDINFHHNWRPRGSPTLCEEQTLPELVKFSSKLKENNEMSVGTYLLCPVGWFPLSVKGQAYCSLQPSNLWVEVPIVLASPLRVGSYHHQLSNEWKITLPRSLSWSVTGRLEGFVSEWKQPFHSFPKPSAAERGD